MQMANPNSILLFGGNSGIGDALARGLSKKLDCKVLIRVVRTQHNSGPSGDLVIQVEKYSDFSFDLVKDKYNFRAIIVAFGILDESKSISQSIERNLDVNCIEAIKTLENVVGSSIVEATTEIHYTSSLLADFTRNSVYPYALSKMITERTIRKYIEPIHHNFFIWKYAYVQTNLNASRRPSLISSTLEQVTNLAIKIRKPGRHYVPRIARIPSSLLRNLPWLHDHIR
jgi:hypothetical protein